MKVDELEEIARRWCKADGNDPDLAVLHDEYHIPVVKTPFGNFRSPSYAIADAKPLWHAYAVAVMNFAEIGVSVSIKNKD